MELTTTFKLLREADACTSRYKYLRESLRDYADDTPINLLTILEHNGIDDVLWALQATAQNCDKVARLMAADFAEQVIPIWQAYAPNDDRPQRAIQAARDFAHGRITLQERAAARAAAGDAAWDAAGDAARAAAWAAARAAAKAAAGAAAGDAAWAAARAAAGDAAWAAAWAAARAAAGDAAWAAAWAAAGAAAGDAAGDAARAAAGDAAWAAARAKQKEIFVGYLQPAA